MTDVTLCIKDKDPIVSCLNQDLVLGGDKCRALIERNSLA